MNFVLIYLKYAFREMIVERFLVTLTDKSSNLSDILREVRAQHDSELSDTGSGIAHSNYGSGQFGEDKHQFCDFI